MLIFYVIFSVLSPSHATSWKLRWFSWVKSFDDKSGPQLPCCLLHVVGSPLITLLLNCNGKKLKKQYVQNMVELSM